MKWFRQTHPITLKQQNDFMVSPAGWEYEGQIILLNSKRIGVGAVKATGELSLVLPNKYKLIRRDIIRLLIKGKKEVWAPVFEGNPISWDLEMCGFIPVETRYEYKRPN